MRLNIEGIKPREEGLLLDAIERMALLSVNLMVMMLKLGVPT